MTHHGVPHKKPGILKLFWGLFSWQLFLCPTTKWHKSLNTGCSYFRVLGKFHWVSAVKFLPEAGFLRLPNLLVTTYSSVSNPAFAFGFRSVQCPLLLPFHHLRQPSCQIRKEQHVYQQVTAAILHLKSLEFLLCFNSNRSISKENQWKGSNIAQSLSDRVSSLFSWSLSGD